MNNIKKNYVLINNILDSVLGSDRIDHLIELRNVNFDIVLKNTNVDVFEFPNTMVIGKKFSILEKFYPPLYVFDRLFSNKRTIDIVEKNSFEKLRQEFISKDKEMTSTGTYVYVRPLSILEGIVCHAGENLDILKTILINDIKWKCSIYFNTDNIYVDIAYLCELLEDNLNFGLLFLHTYLHSNNFNGEHSA